MVGQFKRLVLLALLSVSAHAQANNGQQPLKYNDVRQKYRIAGLKPNTMDASARLKAQTAAELAVVQIDVDRTAKSNDDALDLARSGRDDIEDLIQSLSHNSSDFTDRREWSDFYESEFRKDRHRIDSAQDDTELFTATARFSVTFKEFDALQQFISTIEDSQQITVDRVRWKLTPETKKRVMSELRYDALEELRRVGLEYENAFGVLLKSMEDYTEDRNDRFYYEEDEDDRSSMYDWDSIRTFFTAAGDEPKVGMVSSFLNVKCKFVAGQSPPLNSETPF